MTGTKNTYVPEWIEWPEWVEWPEWQDAGCFAGCQDNGHAANWKFIHVKRGRQAYRRPARWKADRRPRPVPGFRALKHLKADYRNFDTFSAYPWPRVECECECEDVAPLRDSFGIREELSPAEKNRAELGWVCGFPWVWWDRRQFVWMMLNELSPPPWTLSSWMEEKCRAQKSITCILWAAPVRYYILLDFCYFVSCCAFHRILWIAIQFLSFEFSLQSARWRVSWFDHNMICLSLGFHPLGGGVNWLDDLNVVLFSVWYFVATCWRGSYLELVKRNRD